MGRRQLLLRLGVRWWRLSFRALHDCGWPVLLRFGVPRWQLPFRAVYVGRAGLKPCAARETSHEPANTARRFSYLHPSGHSTTTGAFTGR